MITARTIMSAAWLDTLKQLRLDGVLYTKFGFSNVGRLEFLWLYDDEGTLLRKLNDHQVYEALQEGRITDVEK